jgi:hypothetical protein
MDTDFREGLTFTVAPGSYPSGAYAILHVHAEGSVAATPGTFARLLVSYKMVEEVFIQLDAPAAPLDTDFTLTVELVAPGTNLSNPVVRVRRVFGRARSRSITSEIVSESATSSVSSEVICMEVTPGVTWVSESGLFPDDPCPAQIPTGSPWALVVLLTVIVGTGFWIASGTRLGRREAT